jgi:hypothetical protein
LMSSTNNGMQAMALAGLVTNYWSDWH